MKVGKSPRGIIAAGRAFGKAFEVAHWDLACEKKIDLIRGYRLGSTFG